MNSPAEKTFLRALRGEVLDVPPIWIMRQAGRYLPEYRALREQEPDFLSFCYNPDMTVEATLQPIRRYGFDAAILFSDILVIPDALGQKVWFEGGVGPKLEAIENATTLVSDPEAAVQEHLAPVLETVSRLRRELPPETALIGFAGAPWTVASYMVEGGSSRDFANLKKLAYGNPDALQGIMDRLVETTTAYLIAQVEAGAEALQLFDTWAGVLPPSEFQRWVINPTKRIRDGVKARFPDLPLIGFPRGAGLMLRPFVEQTGVDAVSIDTATPIGSASYMLGGLPVQGNLDPIHLISGGEALDRAVDEILEAMQGRPHLFNLGHGVTPPTPPEHVQQMIDRVRRSR
jgi:uroporphyrinogen decarboxylase